MKRPHAQAMYAHRGACETNKKHKSYKDIHHYVSLIDFYLPIFIFILQRSTIGWKLWERIQRLCNEKLFETTETVKESNSLLCRGAQADAG